VNVAVHSATPLAFVFTGEQDRLCEEPGFEISVNVTAAPGPGFGLTVAERTVELLLVAGGVMVTGLTLDVTDVVLAAAELPVMFSVIAE
jgi:hypothetical protein